MIVCLTRHASTHGEQIPTYFLELFRTGLYPTLRSKAGSIHSKYLLVLVKHPCIDTDDSTLREVNAGYGFATRRNVTLEDETNCGVYAEGFVDNCDTIRRPLSSKRLSLRGGFVARRTDMVNLLLPHK